MVKTTVYLEKEIVAALKRISKRSAKPRAQLVRDALREFVLYGTVPALPAGMGLFDSGHSNTTVRRKELLKEALRHGRRRQS